MIFLIDAQLPPTLSGWLQARGHTAIHIAQIGMMAACDIEIAERAEIDGAIIISKDEDFVALSFPDKFGLLWLRCGNASNRALVDWLDQRWDQIEELLARGERLIEAR